MKIGDLVNIDNRVMHGAGYGIIIALHWNGDTNMVSVIINGDAFALPFYRHELEVVSGKRN